MSIEGNVKENENLKNLRGKLTYIPRVDKTLTKQGHSADAKVVGDALKELVRIRDIIDNMITDDPNKPVSARQLFLLAKQVATINLSEAGTVGYDNSESGINASNMQGAIDELAAGVENSVSKTGGSLIEGILHIRNADNGYGSFAKNNSETEDAGTCMQDTASNGKTAKVNVSAGLNRLSFVDIEGKERNVFHEGNKTFGTYTGNGIENERMVDTKGIGKLILVYNSQYFSFVTSEGALVMKLSAGAFSWIESTKVYFADGNLELHTTNAAFNEVDVVYNYQVL